MPALPELSIAHYRHFLLVAELRSFRAAAARAFRSQPALSLIHILILVIEYDSYKKKIGSGSQNIVTKCTGRA